MKSLRALVIALFIPVAAWSQVTYTLPATEFIVEVKAVKENYIAGPYALYARQYLGIDVPLTDYCVTTITEVRFNTALVADMTTTYTLPFWRSKSKFMALTAQGLVAFKDNSEAENNKWAAVQGKEEEGKVLYESPVPESEIMHNPIPWEVDPEKSVEEMAKDAAEIILSARRERYNISIGNTDATFNGEALGHALAELQRLENEYLPLFTGTRTVEEQSGTYTVYPLSSRIEHHYPVFAISETEGLVQAGADQDDIFYLDMYVSPSSFPGLMPVQASGNKPVIHYRVPVLCSVKLSDGHQVLFNTQAPVYQLGPEETCPAK